MVSSRETLFYRDRYFQMQECFGILNDLFPHPDLFRNLQREIEQRTTIFYDNDINSAVLPKTLFVCIIDQYCHTNRILMIKSRLLKVYRINRSWFHKIRSKYLEQMDLLTPVDRTFRDIRHALWMEA